MSNVKSFKLFFFAILLLMITSCGGGSSTTATEPTPVSATQPSVFTGVFVDSPVENLKYTTASNSGETTIDGEFSYQANETIIFSIGDITFPEVDVDAYLTPLNLFNSQDINQTSVVNALRLLQSLDVDGDASNGITITELAHQLASGLSVDFASADFASQVADLIAMSGAINTQLITAEQAVDHFQQTLNELNDQGINTCEKTHAKVGYSGFFETFFHNVAGKATILDDCTIQITQFDYDGGGPEVYFYAAKNHQYSSSDAFSISQKINGQEYQNATFILRLPDGKTLDDFTGISVWCVDFQANFGQMEFTP